MFSFALELLPHYLFSDDSLEDEMIGVVHMLYNALEGGGVVSDLLYALYEGGGLFLLMLYNTLHPRPIFRQTVY